MTKQYIKENLFRKNGTLSPYKIKHIKETKEELYLIYNELETPPKCTMCEKQAEFISFTKGYKETCGDKYCISEKASVVRRKTNLERYGDENYNNPDKHKESRIKNNGSYWSDDLLEKVKKTKLERYGDENYNNRDKFTETNLVRYGGRSPMADPEICKKAQNKARKNNIKKGKWLADEVLSDYKLYKRIVNRITEQNYKKYNSEINPLQHKRGKNNKNKEYYQLDHIYSKRLGFDNNILPHIIASKENLQMLPWLENNHKSSIMIQYPLYCDISL